ncbi:hypothetical protein EMIHUDRAFT_118897 [Emiliania huxleyi CCMP1516]|uniref:Uncharacterized protein n=2 Tax=Emiliania huxleyi TaxID=2903 RepID=A0A0D3IZH9_EMIH1|nr:hypothetical protein EMIHUDRAFT_118897 [Emiliania huxleyi CCMP1516]EOD16664.1 hypothetical protein EMIHUDRAFT_118897 [Emiliania huxleyi CCMP1516]|eukprot:XP_005769093.1 hypothetical protein EMIHUDRAFT_118897 [Emiliania huxleyi CCMP1516]
MHTELKKALQQEVLAAKSRWGGAIKLSKAPAGTPTAPLPIGVERTIARPASAEAFDVDDLRVRLLIDGPSASAECVRVEVSGDALPAQLQAAAAARVAELWGGILTKYSLAAPAAGGPFAIERVLAWCETKYTELLNLLPELVEGYDGVNEVGVTIRRYCLVDRAEGGEGGGGSSSEEEEEGEGEGEGGESSSEESGGRRKEAEALGEDARAPQGLSKKQQEASGVAMKKEKLEKKQGTRLRKQGAKANKFDAEAAGKKANKKNGLLH